MEPRYIVCWLSIYFEISSCSLLHVALVDPVVRFHCATPVDPVVGMSSPEITIIGIRAYRLFPYKWYQSHAPNLVMCGRSPKSECRSPGRRHRCSERYNAVQRKKRRHRHRCSERHSAVLCSAAKRAQAQAQVQAKKHNAVQRSD